MTRSETLKNVATVAVLAGVYFVAGKLGLQLAYLHASATAVWPCTGIAIAALLVFGYRVWPGILIGAFFVNVTTAGSATTSIAIAAGNTLEGLAACYLVNRFA
ncbi:MAG: MASE1 domain-containing protein, partial [Candidatus Acidiferrum sp.]